LAAPSEAKLVAARKAAELVSEKLEYVETLGIGTGSTVKLVVEHLLRNDAVRSTLRRRNIYASSLDTLFFLRAHGLEPSPYIPGSGIDLYFDGADEIVVDPGCYVVKGRGAALTREKIFAYNSREVIIVVDESKLSPRLGGLGKPLPVEVLPEAVDAVISFIKSKGIRVSIRNECKCRDGPALSDNHGVILDVWPWSLVEPRKFIEELERVPGVIEHGFFHGLVDEIVIGYTNGPRLHKCQRTVINPAILR